LTEGLFFENVWVFSVKNAFSVKKRQIRLFPFPETVGTPETPDPTVSVSKRNHGRGDFI